MKQKIKEFSKKYWGRVFVVGVPALFTLLETTGWGFLSVEQHQAILSFGKAMLAIVGI